MILNSSGGVESHELHAATPDLRDRIAALFVECREDVFRYVVTLGAGAEEAQEVAQEAFLRLYAALRKGDRIQNPRAWVFRVAHNLGVDRRAGLRVMQPFDPEVMSRVPDRARDAEQRAIEDERVSRVRRAVEDLSPQQKQCLRLRAQGFRYREIGEITGIRTSTVSEFLARAMAKLKRAIHD